ncbi:hypothetical protein GCM10010446_24020 [Streptomyces enissocaesilis]|uniref:Uncharacterized protein n=1 Tax=Streptomyces enissocaesilis TaxID=332589 RepID=A0ABN3X619_9ACTN
MVMSASAQVDTGGAGAVRLVGADAGRGAARTTTSPAREAELVHDRVEPGGVHSKVKLAGRPTAEPARSLTSHLPDQVWVTAPGYAWAFPYSAPIPRDWLRPDTPHTVINPDVDLDDAEVAIAAARAGGQVCAPGTVGALPASTRAPGTSPLTPMSGPRRRFSGRAARVLLRAVQVERCPCGAG